MALVCLGYFIGDIMKFARTINDLVALFNDFEINLALTNNAEILIIFPLTEKEKEYKLKQNEKLELLKSGRQFEHPPKDDSVRQHREVTYVIRSLVENPTFHRKTTVAHQLATFCLANNKQNDTEYGKIKTRKKAGEPFHMIFENMEYAKKFLQDLQDAGDFEEIDY